TQSDTEVLLKACMSRGARALDALRGMFAFAWWNPRTRRVLLARDRVGIKPLYWTVCERGGRRALLFASEVRALLASGLVERRIDPVALESFLWNGFSVGPRTFVAGVGLLPAGASLDVDLDARTGPGVTFWAPSATPGDSRDPGRLRAELLEAMRIHQIADVPLGVFLSGGVDSSAMTALAARSTRGSVRTFNIGFAEAEFDEAPHARAVAAAIGTEHTEIKLTESDFRSQLGDALGCIDQPTFDALNTYFVSRAVREAGITVALAGTGGDELFGGYASFRDLPRVAAAGRALAALPDGLLRGGSSAVNALLRNSAAGVPAQTRWGKLGDALCARGDLLQLYQLAYALFTPSFLQSLYPSLGRTEFGLPPERAVELRARAGSHVELHGISLYELALFLGERLLRDTDTASMAVALEVRVPLVDHRVVEETLALEPATRFAPLGRKQLLRTLGLEGLDPALFERPKRGFVLPIGVWCRRHLSGQVAETLGDTETCRSLGLDPRVVARLWAAFQAGSRGVYWSRVWALFVLLRWCRQHRLAL
ncbi:MAG TPA: asparagine synthase (glutamine-hydrolyzing), partial [Myxococcota bacterium]|nr:asparagine synthase (glutamine-hydrolyzing) [Myxococcota bacterium]